MALPRPRRYGLICRLMLVLVLLGGSAHWLPLAQAQERDIRYFRIGTGSTGGTYFPIGGMLATIISKPVGSRPCDRGGSCGVAGLVGVAQASRGSVDNIRQMARGVIESGLAQADVAFWAFKGVRMFRKGYRTGDADAPRAQGAISDLRVIAALYPEKIHLVVRADSTIKTLKDLVGKRVVVGAKGSGTLAQVQLVLAASGLSERRFRAHYLKPLAASEALKQRKIDAFFLVAGEPTPLIVSLAETIPIRLVSIDSQTIARLIKKHPYFQRSIIVTGTYRNVIVAETIAVQAQWLVSAKVDATIVYGITRALWSQPARKILDSGHAEGRRIILRNALDGLALPLHPGAARYYRERGLLKAKKDPAGSPTTPRR